MYMTKQKILVLSLIVFLFLLAITIRYMANPTTVGNQTTQGASIQETANEENTKGESTTMEEPIQVIADRLEIPWEIAFLPDNSLLVTQRPGTLLHIQENSKQSIPVSGVEHIGEGGLLGVVLHPNYDENNWIYLYLTSETKSGLRNRVERYTLDERNNTLNDRVVIIENIPGAVFHDGGRMAFGPDGYLYITTGDAGTSASAQNTSTLAGKILRITDEGKAAPGNPFMNPVYSYGHRNPQGIAWDSNGNLWETEHGPSGTTTGLDEVNLIEMGKNYGWPTITGTKTKNGMVTPVLQSGSKTTWAPAGLAIHEDTLYFTGLRGEGLYSAKISGKKLINFKKHFDKEFGRLRAVTVSPDKKWLYISTSNKDGRGAIKQNDDKVIKINFSVFQ